MDRYICVKMQKYPYWIVCVILFLTMQQAFANCPFWTNEEAKQNMQALVNEIAYHNDLYYRKNQPIISDGEFDALTDRLSVLKECFVNIKLLESSIQSKNDKQKIPHKAFMGSLKKAKNISSVIQFVSQLQSHSDYQGVMIQPKIDGVAVELVYQKGRLVFASTRGDGYFGHDILNKIKYSTVIPQKIANQSAEIVLHGELFIPLMYFNTHLRNRYTSARHFVASVLQKKDNVVELLSKLVFFPWRWVNAKSSNEIDIANRLSILGFPLVNKYTKIITTANEIEIQREFWFKEDQKLPFLTDGVVIKANSLKQQLKSGWNTRYPKWALAWKYQPTIGVSEVLDIHFLVGRTGKITPIAIIKPIHLKQHLVQKVTLANIKKMQRHNIHVGDQISVEFKGNAIPIFRRVAFHNPNGKNIETPNSLDYNVLTCVDHSKKCSQQFIARLEWFVKSLSLSGINEAIFERLIANKQLNSLVDIVKLTNKELLMVGLNQSKSQSLLAAIKDIKNIAFIKQLQAVSIPYIGKKRAGILSHHYQSWRKLLKAKSIDLKKMLSLSDVQSLNIIRYFNKPSVKQLLLAMELSS